MPPSLQHEGLGQENQGTKLLSHGAVFLCMQAESYALPLLRLVERTVEKVNGAKTSALNFGCGPGISSFLLTRLFQKVVGVDYGGRFIDAGMRLQTGKAVEYGGLTHKKVAKATDFEGVDPERVVFKQV